MNRNWIHRNHGIPIVALLIIVAAVSTSSSKGQSKPPTLEELWIDVPSSPLQREFTESKRDSVLYNRSTGVVIGYRLGCVTSGENTKLKVVQEGRCFNADLEPAKGLLNSVHVHQAELEQCLNTNTRLAVIEVLFKDGFAWKAASP